jgi:hypothetical protein
MIRKMIIVVSLIISFFIFPAPSMVARADLEDPGSIDEMKEPIVRIFNIVVSLVGVVLVAVLALGFWKSSMSLGDPRGLEGAKQTWTYAIFGFFIVTGFFLLFSFVTSILGVETVLASPADILDKLFASFDELLSPYDTFE